MLVLMILLLPLRGWAGDAMATDMAVGAMTGLQVAQKKTTPVATEMVAMNVQGTGATAHFHAENADHPAFSDLQIVAKAASSHDCADMQAAPSDSHHAVEGGSTMDCGVCPSCQACHTVALSLNSEKTEPVFNALALPQNAGYKFASADAALSQKPPIS